MTGYIISYITNVVQVFGVRSITGAGTKSTPEGVDFLLCFIFISFSPSNLSHSSYKGDSYSKSGIEHLFYFISV